MRAVAKFVLRALGALLVPASVLAAKLEYLFSAKERVDDATLPNEEALRRCSTVAIVALNQHGKLCANFALLLRSLANHGVALLVFNNGRLAASEIDRLRDIVAHYHERESGKGRDFACYKFGAQALEKISRRCAWRPARVLLLNDSILVIPSRVDKFLAQFLAHREPVVGVTESMESQYHVSSWFLSFSWEVWTTKAVSAYWSHYQPLPSRKWAISRGELGLSKVLTNEGIVPFVMYPASLFLGMMKQMSSEELFQKIDLLPIYFVRKYRDRLSSSRHGQSVVSTEILLSLLLDQESTNQTAFWQLIGALYSDFPFIKKDIFYRGVFSLTQLRSFFDKLRATDNERVTCLEGAVLGVEDNRSFSRYRRLRYLLGID